MISAIEEDDIRILYVDDRQENLLALSQMLKGQPYTLDLALTPQEAFGHLLKNRYGCILCDVQMPETDGYSLIDLVRQDPIHAETPVLFITAHDSREHKQRAFELGAVDYVTKPIDSLVLRTKLRVFAALWKRTRELAHQRHLFEATMNELDEGLVVLGARGQILFVNHRMQELWGEPLTGSATFLDELNALDADTRVPLRGKANPFLSATLGQNHAEVEVAIPRRDAVWSVSVKAVSDAFTESGESSPYVALLVRDISARKAAEVAQSRKNAALEQYAYAASHDLKAPLRHISAFSELLEDQLKDNTDPQVHQSLRFIHRATGTMRDLINGLLAVSTLGAEALVLEDTNLAELCHSVWDLELAPLPDDVTLVVEEPLFTRSIDVVSFRQVLVNLFSNSVKFRRPDVPLRIRVWVEGTGSSQRMFVSDNGIGIAHAQAERVFRAFQRLHSRERYQGSGLGLTLCRKVVELHGGRIFLAPDSHAGATFVIELPQRQSSPNPSP